MQNKLIDNLEVNIDVFPLLLPIYKNNQITIGDLHGNALKLLYFIIKHRIVECKKEHYQRFVEIYRKDVSSLEKKDLSEINYICENLIIKNKTKICLIGDVLADRGQNDFFTLLLLNKLHNESVPLDILYSNHDFTFIECFEKNGIFRSERAWGDRLFGRSMHQLQDLIDRGLVHKNEIITLLRESFLPHLKLISCIIDGHNEVTHFSHARIDEEVIANLAMEMNVCFQANTVIQLASTIAAINHSFQHNYVEKNLVHTLPKKEVFVDKDDPVTFLMWNRDYEILQATTRSYKVNEVYGHDSNGPSLDGVYCLNNTLGAHLEHHSGEYIVLLTSLSQNPKEHQKENQKESNFVNDWFTMPQADMKQVARMLFFGKGLDYSEVNLIEENNAIVVNC